jgi:hypothetical protein
MSVEVHRRKLIDFTRGGDALGLDKDMDAGKS